MYQPGLAIGMSYFVRLATSPSTITTPVAETTGTPGNLNYIDYQIDGIPAGGYFMLGFIDVDGSGGTASTPGDYAAWFGHNGDGNPPPDANVFVSATLPVSGRFDLVLVQR